MSSPCTAARISWRRAINQFIVNSLSCGRETALIFAIPGPDFSIDRVEEAHSADELPADAVVLQELSHLTIARREDALIWSVDRETGEVTGEPRLQPLFAGEAEALSDHLLAQAWAQGLGQQRREAK